jgi:predicted nucleic acid-binding protein
MSRSLHQIPAGSTVMTDANVLVYALTPQAQRHRSCLQLLERSARGELALQAPVATVADGIHRAMVLEFIAQGQAQHSADAVRFPAQSVPLRSAAQ